MLEYLLTAPFLHEAKSLNRDLFSSLVLASRYKEGIVKLYEDRDITAVVRGKVLRVLCVDGLEYSRDGKPVRAGVRFVAKYYCTK